MPVGRARGRRYAGQRARTFAPYGQTAGETPLPTDGEFRLLLLEALDGMDPIDREVLVLRHFEELSNGEAATVLEIPPNTASKRYVRALERLARILETTGLPGPGSP